MADKSIIKRFGAIAVEKGFITKDQFIDAMAMQIEGELEVKKHFNLGAILKQMGYMTPKQIDEVLETIGIPVKTLHEK